MASENVRSDLMSFFNTVVSNVETAFSKFGSEFDARSIESFVESQVKALGALMLEKFWQARAQTQSVPSALPCDCGRLKHYVSKRPRTIRTVLGDVESSERHYYHCDQCGSVAYLGDDLRGCSSFSQLAEERIALVGKEGAFKKAATLLEGLGAGKVSATTVRDVCVRLGERARAQNDADAARQHTPEAARPEEYCRRLAVGVDGIMLGRVDMQHRRRKSARGKVRGKKALTHFFHEVKTLVVFDFDKNGAALRKTYHATQDRVEQFREKVSSEALKRGAARARDLVFLGDGALWIWKTAEELFPHAVQVLDWYHATEHLWHSARAHFGTREKELHAWVETQEAHLWNGRIDSIVEALEEMARRHGRPNESLSEEARMRDPAWVAHRNTHYFKENRGRMNYPEYRSRKLPIGSGVVEASCKHVVGDRLKRTGMRWDEPGAESILALRCHHLNGRWDRLWAA